jgi:hypothetical protein
VKRRLSCAVCMHRWCYDHSGDRGGCLLFRDGYRTGTFFRLSHDEGIRRNYFKPRERR